MILTLLYTGNHLTGTFTNSEDPDEHNAALHQVAHETFVHVFIIMSSNEGSGEPIQMHILTRAFAAKIHKTIRYFISSKYIYNMRYNKI